MERTILHCDMNNFYASVMSLSEVMRKRLILHYEEGITVKKIAEIEGVSECSVKDSLRLAKKKIKKFKFVAKKLLQKIYVLA